jgi:hypothetical protein
MPKVRNQLSRHIQYIFLIIIFITVLISNIVTAQSNEFLRGDSNGDGIIDISDGVFILGSLFLGEPKSTCSDAADVNDDGVVDISDPKFLFEFLFSGGNAPPAPVPNDILNCEEPSIFDLNDPESPTFIILQTSVSDSYLVAKDLTDTYKYVGVYLYNLDHENTIELFSYSDSNGFLIQNGELHVIINQFGNQGINQGPHELILQTNTIQNQFIEKRTSVNVRSLPSFVPQSAITDNNNHFLPLQNSFKKNSQAPLDFHFTDENDEDEFLEPPIDVPTDSNEPFCNALSIGIYRCTDVNSAIKNENGDDMNINVGDLVQEFSNGDFFDVRTGDKLQLPPSPIDPYFKQSTCFFIIGLVETSDFSDIKKCPEGQEVKMTIEEQTNIGPVYSCLKGHNIIGISLLTSSNNLPNGQGAHCYDNSDNVKSCIYHTANNNNPENNYGHSPSYSGDDYHRTKYNDELKFIIDNNGRQIQAIKRSPTKKYKLLGVADNEESGKRFMVIWSDKPNTVSINWNKKIAETPQGTIVRRTGDSSRKDRFHSYLLSDDCSEGQQGEDKGKHVCFDVQYNYKFKSKPGDAGWNERPPNRITNCEPFID